MTITSRHEVSGHESRRRPELARVAVWCGLLVLVGMYVLFVISARGRYVDHRVMTAVRPRSSAQYRLAAMLQYALDVRLVVLAVVIALVYAAIRHRRIVEVLIAGAAAVGLVVSARVIKVSLPRDDPYHVPNSYPSGHVAATCALLLVIALCWRGAQRYFGATIAIVSIGAMAITVMIVQAHRPSDLVGSVALLVIWWGIAEGILSSVERSTQ